MTNTALLCALSAYLVAGCVLDERAESTSSSDGVAVSAVTGAPAWSAPPAAVSSAPAERSAELPPQCPGPIAIRLCLTPWFVSLSSSAPASLTYDTTPCWWNQCVLSWSGPGSSGSVA